MSQCLLNVSLTRQILHEDDDDDEFRPFKSHLDEIRVAQQVDLEISLKLANASSSTKLIEAKQPTFPTFIRQAFPIQATLISLFS